MARCCPTSACAVVCDVACGEVIVIEHDPCCGTSTTGAWREGGIVEPAGDAAPVPEAPQVAAEPSAPATRPAVEPGVPDLKPVDPVEPVSATVDPAVATPPAVTAAPQEPAAPAEPAPRETAPAPAEPDMPEETATTPVPAVTEPEESAPVEPVVAAPEAIQPEEEPEEEMEEEAAVTEPAVEPEPSVPAVPAEPETVQPVVEPVAEEMDEEENLFEEVDESPAAAAPAEPADPDDLFGEPAEKPAVPAPAPAPGQSLEDILGGGDPPAADAVVEPQAEPAVTDAAPGDEDVPAVDPPPADDVNPFPDDARHKPGEPARRWIDDTGRYATVGVLVAVHADAVELRKQDGRTVTVPFRRLSDHDRGYALEAGARIAARGMPTPRPSDTAGL